MSELNYHHLRYFRAIVREGTLTKAAESLNVSQSSISVQLKQLEQSLGIALFDRQHKSLSLTEEGRMVFDYAETIFRTGEEMLTTLHNRSGRYSNVLRVGAVSTLSKNFQLSFLREVLDNQDVEVIIHSSSTRQLLSELNAHTIDLVLSNNPVRHDTEQSLISQLVDEQPVSLVCPTNLKKRGVFQFPEDLRDVPMVLPSRESNIRTGFDLIIQQANFSPLVAAEVDDMAMLRLIARETEAVALVPQVVVKDELESGKLIELYRVPMLYETFYAITAPRRYPNPYVKDLLRAKPRGD